MTHQAKGGEEARTATLPRTSRAPQQAQPSQGGERPTLCAAEPAIQPNRDALTLDFLITILGFGLCRAWIIFCLGAPLIVGATYSLNWMYLVFGSVSALAISFAASRRGKRDAACRLFLFRFAPLSLLASGITMPLALWMQSETLLAVGFVLGGLAAGPLQVLWGDRFAQHPTQFAAFASPAAATITALVAALSTDHTSFIGFAVLPLVSFGLLVCAASRTGVSWNEIVGRRKGASESGLTPQENENSQDDEKNRDAVLAEKAPRKASRQASQKANSNLDLGVGKLMFSIMTFSFLCRIFDSIPTHDDPFAFAGGSPIFSLIVVGVVFFAIVAKLRERFNATLTYRLSLPIMVAGFVAIALFFDTHAAMSLLLINVGYEFFDILTWVLFVDASRRRNENALHIFGLGVAFMFAGMALGNMAGGIIDAMVASGSVQITVVAMLATLCLVVVAFMVLPEGVVAQLSSTVRPGRKEREGEAEAVAASSADTLDEPTEGRIEQHCAAAALAYGLTPRESEVIVLLAYGRTLSIIARDLQIAKGTARTHIENIYRKLDVHKQQELIDLVESMEA